MRVRSIAPWALLSLSLSWIHITAGPARARVQLPGGQTVPDPAVGCFDGKPGGLGVLFACSCLEPDPPDQPGLCNIGAHCSSGPCPSGARGTCESTLSYKTNEDPCIPTNLVGLDPVDDAATRPETFTLGDGCGLTFTLLAREAQFKNAFGWYNVRADGRAPDPADLHVLVDCNTAIGQAVTLDITADYAGGEIGFFLVTPQAAGSDQCAGGDCCASLSRLQRGEGFVYYSQPAFNPDSDPTVGDPFVHLLVYASRIEANRYYFAWEDTLGGQSTEYTDFVTRVSNIAAACQGAGAACDTGQPGSCGAGVTSCGDAALGQLDQLICRAAFEPEPERCDGLDNDCDNEVDERAPCADDRVCFRGRCAPRCRADVEFSCPYENTVCDEARGICVDPRCAGIDCPGGQLCHAGQCVDGCGGVVCPAGQLCRAGLCVDLCSGRVCEAGRVCVRGQCLPGCGSCSGLQCGPGEVCNASTGRCGCDPPCDPGSHCEAGRCLDDCAGVICPLGQSCDAGQCVQRCSAGRCLPGLTCVDGHCVVDRPALPDSTPPSGSTDVTTQPNADPQRAPAREGFIATDGCQLPGRPGGNPGIAPLLLLLIPWLRARQRKAAPASTVSRKKGRH